MKHELSRHAPPGYELKPELDFFAWGLVLCALCSLAFCFRLDDAIRALYRWDGVNRTLYPGVSMPDYRTLLGGWPFLFVLHAAAMLSFSVLHYASHYRGSRSIYLMRRLPKRWELHRRCLTLPLFFAAMSLLALLLLIHLYLAVYLIATPDVCLTPGQWQKIWSVIP